MVTLPPIGLGTGGPSYLSDDQCVDIVSSAIEGGYRHIDTAQTYENEEWVGEGVVEASIPRDDVIVATKLDRPNMGAEAVRRTTLESLDRLGFDTIDLLYAHFPTHSYSPTETIPAMCELVDDGLVRHLGVSNFSPDELDEAQDIAEYPIVANQIEMHPLYQRADQVAYAQENDLTIVAYSPLSQGAVFDLPEITQIADKHGVNEAVVTLAWLAEKNNVVAIPKTTSKEHLTANFDAKSLELYEDDIATIDGIEREEPIYDF